MSARRRRNGATALAPVEIANSGRIAPSGIDSNEPMGRAITEVSGAKVFQRTAVMRWCRLKADENQMRLEQLWLASDGSGEWRAVPVEVEA